jgi:hypothetical protein
MRKILLPIILLALVLIQPPPASAQSTATWTGFYFANPNLQGAPIFARDDAGIDFNWGAASPGEGIPADNFSVRWVRWIFVDTPGDWTFTTTTDDGVRLFVDDQLVLDSWRDQTLATHSITRDLSQAFHLVRLEYFERGGSAQAHLEITPASFPNWRGEYFNNPDLVGTPAFTRNDAAINFDFGSAGPGGGVPGASFSARWTRAQIFDAGRYRFTTTTDDGVRLWIDHQLAIDQWHDQVPTSHAIDVNLTDGVHWLRLDYYQHGGGAVAQLKWSPVSGNAELWRGEFFSNPNLEGAPVLAHDDTAINFDWGNKSPGVGVPGANWSARWSARRTINNPGFYTTTATADDGVRVSVDNNLVIDEFHDQSPALHSAMTYLTAGAHDWRIEYYQRSGNAQLRVQIEPGAVSASANPLSGEITVDPANVNFAKGGDAAGWRNSNGVLSTTNNLFAISGYNWARWYAALPRAGDYEVFVYIPAGIATTRSARYEIARAGDFAIRTVNQLLYANQWVSLGAFYFHADGSVYVALSDVTYEPLLSTTLVFDAVKFSAR